MDDKQNVIVVVKSTKSMGLGILLTFLFGPLGMLYSTVTGALIMILINIIVAFVTLGIGFIVTWPIQIIWTVIAINSYNDKLIARK